MPFWHRLVIAGVVFLLVSLVARFVDWRLSRKPHPPELVTRYIVLRRSLSAGILIVGLFSALLVIPQVRAVAGGLLASSAVVGIIVGFASQRTLGNFVAGILIALSQPVRLGDRIEWAGSEGVVEEIGLTYTFVRTQDDARIVIPNEKLASDTIRNSTIRSRQKVAEITVQVPLSTDVGAVGMTVRARADDEDGAQKLERDLRLRVHSRFCAAGVYA